MDIVDADDDPNLFLNGTVALLLVSLGMGNAISMCFGDGKPAAGRQNRGQDWERIHIAWD